MGRRPAQGIRWPGSSAAVAQAIAELRQWRERHRHLTELSEFFDAIDSEEEE